MSTGAGVLSPTQIRFTVWGWVLVGVLGASALTAGLAIGRASAPTAVRTRLITEVVPASSSYAPVTHPFSDPQPVSGAAAMCTSFPTAVTQPVSGAATAGAFSEPVLRVATTCPLPDRGIVREDSRG